MFLYIYVLFDFSCDSEYYSNYCNKGFKALVPTRLGSSINQSMPSVLLWLLFCSYVYSVERNKPTIFAGDFDYKL